ncbi:MAG: hypothetical protein PHN44_09705 [Candidatus Marinimicrobia bacterium]|nr:hypothetical protein [Candidatus Neomarinimicrobiota bacterium]
MIAVALLLVVLVVLVVRFLSGRPVMHRGLYPTDATFLRRGTRSTDPARPFPSRWALLPGWKRAAWRVGVSTVGVVSVWAWWHARGWLVAVLVIGLLAVTARWLRRRHDVSTPRRFREVYVSPLAHALSPVVGMDPTHPESWLHIDPALGELASRLVSTMRPLEVRVRAWYGEHVSPVVWWLPDRVQRVRWWLASLSPVASVRSLVVRPVESRPVCVEVRAGSWVSPEARAAAGAIVSAKLGLGDLRASWDAVGPRVVARWTIAVRPPARCGLAEIREAIDAAADHELVLGLQAGGTPFVASLDDDAAHIGVSAGSGAGKSVLAQLAAVQVLRRGGRVVILDRKGSHRWARGLSGVTYCSRPADMHAALIGLAEEADARNSQAMEEDDDWRPADRVLVVFEEMNAGIAQLRTWWERTREKSDPKVSPAISAYQDLAFMGRSAQVHIFGIAQMMTAALGGSAARENMGIRCLARYTRNNWMMMAPECPMPRPSKVRGRWQIVVAGVATAVQVAYLSTAEARELAAPGVSIPGLHPGLRCPDSPAGIETPADEGLADVVSLSEALDRGLVDGRRYAVAKRLLRDPAAPAPVGKRGRAWLYDRAALTRWAEGSAGVADG